jgi:hypothetical protein
MAWSAGLGRASNPAYRYVGVGLLVLSLTLMWVSIRYWAKYFVGVCLLFVLNAVYALVSGHTLNYPRLNTNPQLVLSELAFVLASMAFAVRFTTTPPQTAVDSVALVVAVAGLFGTMITEPKLWPMGGGVIALAAAWAWSKWHPRPTVPNGAQS